MELNCTSAKFPSIELMNAGHGAYPVIFANTISCLLKVLCANSIIPIICAVILCNFSKNLKREVFEVLTHKFSVPKWNDSTVQKRYKGYMQRLMLGLTCLCKIVWRILTHKYSDIIHYVQKRWIFYLKKVFTNMYNKIIISLWSFKQNLNNNMLIQYLKLF